MFQLVLYFLIVSRLTSIPKPLSSEIFIMPFTSSKGFESNSLLKGWLDWSYSKIGSLAKIEKWVAGIEAITWIDAAWAIAEPHTWGINLYPKTMS